MTKKNEHVRGSLNIQEISLGVMVISDDILHVIAADNTDHAVSQSDI